MFKKKMNVLTVKQYVERRNPNYYGKTILVVNSNSYNWWDNADKVVDSVKVTTNYCIITVKEN